MNKFHKKSFNNVKNKVLCYIVFNLSFIFDKNFKKAPFVNVIL